MKKKKTEINPLCRVQGLLERDEDGAYAARIRIEVGDEEAFGEFGCFLRYYSRPGVEARCRAILESIGQQVGLDMRGILREQNGLLDPVVLAFALRSTQAGAAHGLLTSAHVKDETTYYDHVFEQMAAWLVETFPMERSQQHEGGHQ
jgi:hypothetical protein